MKTIYAQLQKTLQVLFVILMVATTIGAASARPMEEPTGESSDDGKTSTDSAQPPNSGGTATTGGESELPTTGCPQGSFYDPSTGRCIYP